MYNDELKRTFFLVIFFRDLCTSYQEGRFLYSLCYHVDKKGHRKGKIIDGKDCKFKKYAYFCDENKRTFSLVILKLYPIQLSSNHLGQ